MKEAYDNKKPLEKYIHNLALDLVYRYLLVGGMPEAVQMYLDNENLLETRATLEELYDNYLSDMELYQASREAILRSRALFKNVYRQLNKKFKNFSPGFIEEKSKTRDYEVSLHWLTMAHVLYQSFELKERVRMP